MMRTILFALCFALTVYLVYRQGFKAGASFGIQFALNAVFSRLGESAYQCFKASLLEHYNGPWKRQMGGK